MLSGSHPPPHSLETAQAKCRSSDTDCTVMELPLEGFFKGHRSAYVIQTPANQPGLSSLCNVYLNDTFNTTVECAGSIKSSTNPYLSMVTINSKPIGKEDQSPQKGQYAYSCTPEECSYNFFKPF